ncbi:MAG: PEP-CTERM sorting domain-containing protein [Planctomycetota bacterium]
MDAKSVTACVALALVTGGAASAQVVDQSQPLENHFIFFARPDLAQSFMQAADNIVGAEIKLWAAQGSGPGDVTIELWDRLPPQGGRMLATGTERGVQPGAWATVWWPVVSVVPETTYYLVFHTTNTSFGISIHDGNPYSRGMVFAMPGFQPYPQFDYTFQTYAVPEPAGLSVLALLVTVFARRRSR